ncbi:MAG: hypothetical protein LBH22_02485 [Bacteroidales bacterium]|nr:hypothetical protein [Bacteroidales bacterium]
MKALKSIQDSIPLEVGKQCEYLYIAEDGDGACRGGGCDHWMECNQ